MKKHTYRAQKVNKINWLQVQEQTIGETLVLAVDVAKVQQYALLTNQEHTQSWLMQWSHLEHTPHLIEQLKALAGRGICPVRNIRLSPLPIILIANHKMDKLGRFIYANG